MCDFEKKVKLTVPEYIIDFLESDMYDFDLNKNNICNRIVLAHYEKKDNLKTYSKTRNAKNLQFTLSNLNLDLYIDADTNLNIQHKSDYFRNIFFNYCQQPRYMRELALNNKTVQLIEQSIQSKKKLTIRYNNQLRVIEAYAILQSDNETRNYVFCYCHKRKEYRNFRLCNIEAITIHDKEPFEVFDSELVERTKAKFDPFLSVGKVVKVKLTELGLSIYNSHITHRPQILTQYNDNIYDFECSEARAKLYFTQFLGEVEILEPIDLREWFKDGAQKMSNIYK